MNEGTTRVMNNRRRAGMAIVLAILVGAGGLVIAAATLHGFSVNSAATNSSASRVVVAVEGMHCDSCAAGIRSMLKRTPGVIAAEVSYKDKQAVVDYDSQKTTPAKIVEAINNLGYKAKLKD